MTKRMRIVSALLVLVIAVTHSALADAPSPGVANLPHVVVDVKNHRVLVECQALNITAPLEFFCVEAGGNEHESVLRTPAKASDVHTALLMLGLKPGGNVRYVQSSDTWLPPFGPPLHIFCDYLLNGKAMHVPAYRMMRSIKTHEEMSSFTWVFCGSKVMSDGTYAADVTSYVVSIVNFDYTLIDVPALKSNSNETLEWEENPDLVPPKGTPVTMIIEPAGQAEDNGIAAPPPAAPETPAPTTSVAGPNTDEGTGPFGEGAGPIAPSAPAPTGPILMKLITIDADGHVAIDHAATQPDALTDALTALKKNRPVKVTIAADENAPRDVLDKVIVAVANADVPMDFANASAAPSPSNTGMASSVAAPAAPTTQPDPDAAEISDDEAKVAALKQQWEQAVAPHRDALREAAQAHYDVINEMRRRQQHLIDEADRIQRVIDELEKQYQDMTTPNPSAATQPTDDAGMPIQQ